MAEITNKILDEANSAIVYKPKALAVRINTLNFDIAKNLQRTPRNHEQYQGITYFFSPFASWKCGCNENFKGLLCQVIPNKKAMYRVTDEEIRMTPNRLSNRPRKRWGFIIPAEVFHQSLKCIALLT